MAENNSLFSSTDYTSSFDPKDISDNKVMAILAYFGILVLVPILGAPQSPFAKFHANQGLVLCIAEIAVGLVFGILGIIPFVGIVFIVILWLCEVAIGVLAILGIVYAAQGQAKTLPLISKIQILK